jgi:glycogen debranching enzyme
MLMSKNWLTAVWSWDHCFNAMALSYGNTELAWDQFMLPFDFQRVSGALPDCVNDTQTIWNFCKPPIHGWAVQWLLKRKAIGTQHLQQIYVPLSRWTEWWLRERDDNRNGLAQYNHGNDSGWDNATLFDGGMPMKTPDLSAFLIVQMQMLATIAHRLKKPRAAKQWQRRADGLRQALLQHLWRGDGFVGLRGDEFIESDTLLLVLPLVLGEQLPTQIRKALVEELQNQFLTEHGLASENPNSGSYIPDGYWRGPIWAPSTLLLVDALADIGEDALARTIAARFCALVEHGGMAENFDALTGAPLRDRAHTWSASIFLILAHEYLR